MKMRNVETITHTSFSLQLFVWYIITKTVWFYNYMYIQFFQASITRKTTLVNWFPSLNFRHPLESKGCLKFIQRFPWIDFYPFRYQSIQITWLLTIFIDFEFYLLATPGFNYTRIYTDFILKGRQVKIVKNWAPKPTNQKKILNLVLKKR